MKIIGCLLIFFQIAFEGLPCTIFYGTKDGAIYAGSNEDWSDPASKMFFYPATTQKHGWVKFGWGSGFPQGGMNVCGLFWDATSGPYLSMPVSELQKEKLPGPVMKKIIENCENLEEAKSILAQYYCEDQYRAQYLIGDSLGQSAIVEGDNILSLNSDYQVLTNFYQSNPELGGYPCWRFNTATEKLKFASDFTPALFGEILAATHQEGKFPTQYSVIYNLKESSFYLFYFHNYEEFIFVDLKKELQKGQQTFDIPKLFSSVRIISRPTGETNNKKPATIEWEGKSSSKYFIEYATSPDFSDSKTYIVYLNKFPEAVSYAIILPFILAVGLISGQKQIFKIIVLVLIINVGGCSKYDDLPESEKVISHVAVLENLIAGTTYYWRIKAMSEGQKSFFSETKIYRFYNSED